MGLGGGSRLLPGEGWFLQKEGQEGQEEPAGWHQRLREGPEGWSLCSDLSRSHKVSFLFSHPASLPSPPPPWLAALSKDSLHRPS